MLFRSRPTVSSTWCGRPRARSRHSPGARSSPATTRRRTSPTARPRSEASLCDRAGIAPARVLGRRKGPPWRPFPAYGRSRGLFRFAPSAARLPWCWTFQKSMARDKALCSISCISQAPARCVDALPRSHGRHSVGASKGHRRLAMVHVKSGNH